MTELTARSIAEIAGHEGIVCECYKDSVGVWTWAVGLTNNCGHTVYDRYLDNPQTIAYCMDVYDWVLRNNYLPAVLAAFEGHDLTENELAGALSFHWNTGAISTATWVKSFMAGRMSDAEVEIMNWRTPSSIIPRREKERDLIFHGQWGDGYANVYEVYKPSYNPDWASAQRVNVLELIEDQPPTELPPPDTPAPPEPNPEIDPVEAIKSATYAIVEQIEHWSSLQTNPEAQRCAEIAKTNVQTGSMWAVRAVTLGETE